MQSPKGFQSAPKHHPCVSTFHGTYLPKVRILDDRLRDRLSLHDGKKAPGHPESPLYISSAADVSYPRPSRSPATHIDDPIHLHEAHKRLPVMPLYSGAIAQSDEGEGVGLCWPSSRLGPGSIRQERIKGTEKQETRKANSLAVAFRLDPSDAGDANKILSCSFRW